MRTTKKMQMKRETIANKGIWTAREAIHSQRLGH